MPEIENNHKKRSVAQLTADVDAYITLWGSEQAVTQQQFLDNLAYTCSTCNNFRDLQTDCSGTTTDCNGVVTTIADMESVAAPGSSSSGGGGGGSGPPPGGK